MPRPTISVQNTPDLKALDEYMKRMKAAKVRVGFPRFSGNYPDGTSVAEVAIHSEFGTKTQPERPFFRSTFIKNRQKYADLSKKLVDQVISGRSTIKQACGMLGVVAVGDVQDSISEFSSPGNAPYTIMKKGSTHPLIDTGLMRQSVTYQVIE